MPLAYLRGGNLRFKIDWSSCIVGSKLTIFALFYFVFGGNFPSTSPRGAYIWRGDNNGGSSALLDWGVYIWRGLFSEFYGTLFSTFYFQVSDFEKGFPNKVLRTIDLLNLCRDKMWKGSLQIQISGTLFMLFAALSLYIYIYIGGLY